MDAERELSASKDNLVGIDWIAAHWSVSEDTARDMIRVLSAGRKPAVDVKVLAYGPKIVRYRRSDIERITNDNLVSLREVLALKRAERGKAVRT